MESLSQSQLDAALLLGHTIEAISEEHREGDRKVIVPSNFDPSTIPPLRYATGMVIEEFDGKFGVTIDFSMPLGPRSFRLQPTIGGETREHGLAIAKRILAIAFERDREEGLRVQDRKFVEIAGIPFSFEEETIAVARRTLRREEGRIPSRREITRFFDELLSHVSPTEVHASIEGSPTALCFAAIAADIGLRSWPVPSGHSSYIH